MLIDFDQQNRTIKLGLFKFYPNTHYHLEAFETSQLFLAFPSCLNDGFDTSERLIDPFPWFQRQISWNDINRDAFNSHGICSFIESKDIKNLKMWALYADNYNGFAIEYNSDILNESIPKPLHLMPVSYLDTPLNLDDHELELRVNDDIFKVSKINEDIKYKDRVFQCLHLVKSNAWKDENEWRLVLAENKPKPIIPHSEGYYLPIDYRAFQRLYLGWRLQNGIKKQLMKIAELKGVPVSVVTPMIIKGQWDMEITNLQ